MLRGGRASLSPSLSDLRADSAPAREFLLAMAPIPRSQSYRIAGWPKWLVPAHPAIARGERTSPADERVR